MNDHERLERAAFVRWMKKEHPGVSVHRYGPPARDQYIIPDVQSAWQGWFARSLRYTTVDLKRAKTRAEKIHSELNIV